LAILIGTLATLCQQLTAHGDSVSLLWDLAPEALKPALDREQLLKSIAAHSLGPASLVVRIDDRRIYSRCCRRKQ
jgi:hypothetical protein